MDPPARPHKRRAASAQTSHAALPGNFTPAGSPSPSTSTPKSAIGATETRRPRSNKTVSLVWDEGDDPVNRSTSRLHIDLAECVETKTVTTTTTTKRSYPPLLLHQKPLQSLDTKEYPLARNPTPPELTHISYEIEGQLVNFSGGDCAPRTDEVRQNHFIFPNPKTRIHKFAKYFPQSLRVNYSQLSSSRSISEHASQPDQHRSPAQALSTPDSDDTRSHHPQRPKMKRGSGSQRRSTRVKIETQRKLPAFKGGKNSDEEGDLQESHRHHGLGMHMSENTQFPVTPDTSELELLPRDRIRPVPHLFADTYTPQSGLSQNNTFDDVQSPSDNNHQDTFASAVATPPIAESDLEPIDRANEALASSASQLPPLNTIVVQNASLPSPGLSPTYNGEFDDDGEEDDIGEASENPTYDSQDTIESDHGLQVARLGEPQSKLRQVGDMHAVASMLETFDSLANDMKTFMMFNFLKRCPRKTLHVIADTVNPALKCDFLDQLPMELSLNILTFLDHRDLCRAAQVSKQWRNVIDSNETGWKELLDRDGFVLPAGELGRAIHQGWGWQDPYGPDGFEQDLSVQRASSEGDSTRVETDTVRKVRSTTKRKRLAGSVSSERAKRRAVTGHEFADKAKGLVAKYPQIAEFHKSEGPLTAANAAALAVPDPGLGLPSLRKLHLFKSIYRRRYMLRSSWTSGKTQPHHFAFPAHPSHVITCLQFDDDKILTGSDDTLIHVYDTRTGALRKKLEGHEGGVWALQYEGNVLVSGSTDRSVRVWDIEKGLCTQVFHGHTSTVRCLQILMPEPTGEFEQGKAVMMPEKPLIITGSRDSQLRVWKLPEQGAKRYIQTGPPANDADCPYFVRVLTGHSHSVRAIAAHQDTLVSGSYDNTVRVWKISTGETLHRLQGHSMKVYSVVLDHKRNRCISGSMDNFVKIWSLTTGACLFTLEGHTSLVGLLDLRDERLVSAAADSTLRIWDPENGQCKSTLTAHTGAITCFQHDGQKVISGSDRTLKMWNVKTGECIKDLLTDLSGVWQVKFDERRCVAAVQRDNLTFVEVSYFQSLDTLQY
jgi:F-box and WD-40 domain protein CDC4